MDFAGCSLLGFHLNRLSNLYRSGAITAVLIPHASKFGIYLNPGEKSVVRITSPYWLPEPPEWVYVTGDVNATLLSIREAIRREALVEDPDSVTWGRIPLLD